MLFLPRLPYGSTVNPALNSKASILTPSIGNGPVQRITRPGDRYTWSITTQTMSTAQGMAFISGLLQGLSQRVRCYLYPGVLTGGIPAVGSSPPTGGTSLTVTGAPASYTYAAGRWFSLEHAGAYYLHMVTTTVVASSGGGVTLNFYPALRIAPSQGDILHFDNPAIEGFVDGQSQSWNQALAQTIGLTFSVTEAA